MSTFQMRVFLFFPRLCLSTWKLPRVIWWMGVTWIPPVFFVRQGRVALYLLQIGGLNKSADRVPFALFHSRETISIYVDLLWWKRRSLLIKSVRQWWLTLNFLVFPVTCRWVNHRHFVFFSYCFGNNSARRQFLMKIFCKHHHKSQTGIECVKCNYIYIGRAELLLTWFLWLVLMAYEDAGGSFE